jgi:hypothetical protein
LKGNIIALIIILNVSRILTTYLLSTMPVRYIICPPIVLLPASEVIKDGMSSEYKSDTYWIYPQNSPDIKYSTGTNI